MMRWGLVPSWSKNDQIGSKMINARLETILEKPSFSNLVKNNRCVVLADGYFEWTKQHHNLIISHIQKIKFYHLPDCGLPGKAQIHIHYPLIR